MEKTANYGLPKWVETDPIKMKPFNDAFDDIDKALKANADAAATKAEASTVTAIAQTIASSKICRVKYGTYTGNGLSTADNPNTLECGFCPALFIIVAPGGTTGTVSPRVGIRGYRRLQTPSSTGTCYITWGDTGLSWYASTAEAQFNTSGSGYYYVVLGYDAD